MFKSNVVNASGAVFKVKSSQKESISKISTRSLVKCIKPFPPVPQEPVFSLTSGIYLSTIKTVSQSIQPLPLPSHIKYQGP